MISFKVMWTQHASISQQACRNGRAKSVRERTQRVQPRYRQAKETKCGEMAVGCRSTRIVLMKPGNWSRWTRWREGKTERGCLMLDPGSGNTSEALNLELRINGTAQESVPGMQRCCMANPALEEPYALIRSSFVK